MRWFRGTGTSFYRTSVWVIGENTKFSEGDFLDMRKELSYPNEVARSIYDLPQLLAMVDRGQIEEFRDHDPDLEVDIGL